MNKNNLVRKCLFFGVITLLIGTNIIPLTSSIDVEKEFVSFMDNRTLERFTIFKWNGTHGSFGDYMKGRENKPFSLGKIGGLRGEGDNPCVIVFANSNLLPTLEDEIVLYNSTLVSIGYDTVVLEVSGGTAEDLKDQILFYWDNGYNVTGTVLIGDLPVAWFHHEYDFSGPAEFPCDLFLMDLDGEWIDSDSDGLYDSHTNGEGDTAPEIYIGRIDASQIPGEELTILKDYLQKVHEFWMGNIAHTDFGLTYTDRDWASFQSHRYDIQYAYDDYEARWYPNVNRDDYLYHRLPNTTYEFIQISCHAGETSHSHHFEIGGYLYSDEVRAAAPQALFYNLFTCSSLRFTDYNCLGNAYVLNTSSPSLTVVGSTKVGSMLDFRYFYEPIGQGCSFGQAFQEWFEYEYPYSDYPDGYNDISWFYGMTILGDPTLIPTWDSVLPECRNQGQNKTTIQPGGSIKLYAQGKDNYALNWAYLATNETGEWQNCTGQYGSPMYLGGVTDEWVWSNFTWQNSSIPMGTQVGWRIYYVDSSSNEIATDIMSFYIKVLGDCDDDGDVDQSDLGILLAAWDSHPGDDNWDYRADLDGDGHVYQSDLGILLANWGYGI